MTETVKRTAERRIYKQGRFALTYRSARGDCSLLYHHPEAGDLHFHGLGLSEVEDLYALFESAMNDFEEYPPSGLATAPRAKKD